jgi:hypothetical protein
MEISKMLKGRAIRLLLITGSLLAVLVPFYLTMLFKQPVGIAETALPDFTDFSRPVQNGQPDMLRGVYVADVLALPVAQQPAGNANYVSDQEGEATQYSPAAQFGNVGILAHNHLAGKSFSRLTVGQEVRLVYGDGTVEYFVIAEVLRYQALQPENPWGSFRDLENDEVLTAEQLFDRVYKGDHRVTFQTCIADKGVLSWGRLFVMARPKYANGQQNPPKDGDAKPWV